MESQEILTLEQIVNTLGTSAILWYLFIPTFVVLVTIYTVRRIKFKNELKTKQSKAVKEAQNKSEKPVEDAKYKSGSLALEFDKTGEIKIKHK